jgi:restriction system protein
MKTYYRVMLGRNYSHAKECFAGNFIGADYDIAEDLADKLPEDFRSFNQIFIPVYQAGHPDKSKVSAGLACSFLWTIAKGIKKEDVVLCPTGEVSYYVGEVIGDYVHVPGGVLPHRRSVRWLSITIDRGEMSDALKFAAGAMGAVCNLTRAGHNDEIDKLIGGTIVSTDETVEDPITFALEKHLEDFLVKNWAQTELGKHFNIFEEDGELVGQQYPSDTGPIDILAISKNKKELLVVELKRGRASDHVVGQILRYMGYVLDELADEGQTVKGVIIALEDDLSIRRALAVTKNIEFYRYQVSFKLIKA